MSDNENDDVNLSPQDIEKINAVTALIGQATALLNDISDDVREEYGDIEDAISKLEEVDDLLKGSLPDAEAGSGGAEPAA